MIELNNYPKAKEKYIEWCISKYKVIFPDADLKGKEAETFATLALQSNYRALYDPLDEAGFIVSIINYAPGKFMFGINQEGEESPYSSRRQAEEAAFEDAFCMWEKQLSAKEETV